MENSYISHILGEYKQKPNNQYPFYTHSGINVTGKESPSHNQTTASEWCTTNTTVLSSSRRISIYRQKKNKGQIRFRHRRSAAYVVWLSAE